MSTAWTVYLFWAAAAVCVAIALAFVLPPLLRRKVGEDKAARRDINIAVYRDQMKEMEADLANGLLTQDQFQTAKLELETRLAEDALAPESASSAQAAPTAGGGRGLGYGLAAVLPVAAFGIYMVLGSPGAIQAVAEAQANPPTAQGEHDIMKLIQKVEEKTRQDPKDPMAWTILAKTYSAVGHWPEALGAWEKAIALRPDEPSVMTGYAEALAISNGRVLAGKPLELVLKALEKDPNDLKGLELAGIASYQAGEFAKTAYYFKQLLKQLPPDSPYAQDILAAQQDAEAKVKGALTGMDDLSAKGGEQAAPGASITGVVDVVPALKAKLKDTDVVFLFARSAEAGPPVAAIRAQAGGFPLNFELNDAQAMNPANRLSNFKEVTLTARVAKSGDIKGAAGDLESKPMKGAVGSQGVKVVIDTERK